MTRDETKRRLGELAHESNCVTHNPKIVATSFTY